MGDVVRVQVRNQFGDHYLIDLSSPFDKATVQQIHDQIAKQSNTTTYDIEIHHKVIHHGKLLSENVLESLKNSPNLVLIKRKKIPIHKKDTENKEPISALIAERMKEYYLPDIEIELDEEKVNSLKDMGFSEARVRNALILNSSNTDSALNWLLSRTHDESADEPLSQKQLREILKKQQTFKCDESMVAALLEMGFLKEQIEQALRITNNSLEGACAMLTGEREFPQLSLREVFNDAIQSNPQLSRHASPRINAVLNDIAQNPNNLQRYVSDPEIGPVLLEVFQHLRRLAQ